MGSYQKQNPIRITSNGEMKSVVAAEHPSIDSIPDIVRVTIVAVEPKVVVIALDIEHVEVAIRISNV